MNLEPGQWPAKRSPQEVLADVRRRAHRRRLQRLGGVAVVILVCAGATTALLRDDPKPSNVSTTGVDRRQRVETGPAGVTPSVSVTSAPNVTATPGAGGSATATTQPPSTAPTRPGVTGNEVVLGNVSTGPSALGANARDAIAGARAFVAYQNSIGGLWGRTIRLDVHDDAGLSARNQSETNAAIASSFALLGSSSAVDDASAAAVAAAGLPDASQATTAARQAIADNFTVMPNIPTLAATTSFAWFRAQNPTATSGVGTLYLDESAHRAVQDAHMRAAQAAGWTIRYTRAVAATETDFTPDVIRMRGMGISTLYVVALRSSDAARLVAAMNQQGYHPLLITEGEAALNPTATGADTAYVPSTTALLDGADDGTQPEAALFRTWLARVDPTATANTASAAAWAEGRLLFQAMATAGSSATRADVLRVLKSIHAFSANDLIAPADPAAKQPSVCTLITQNREGRRARVAPAHGFLCEGRAVS